MCILYHIDCTLTSYCTHIIAVYEGTVADGLRVYANGQTTTVGGTDLRCATAVEIEEASGRCYTAGELYVGRCFV